MTIKEQVVDDDDQIICAEPEGEALVDGPSFKVLTPTALTTDEFWQLYWLFHRWFTTGGFLQEDLNKAFVQWGWDLHWVVYELERMRRTRLASVWVAERMEEEYSDADPFAKDERTVSKLEGEGDDE